MRTAIVISFLTILTLGSAALAQKPEPTPDFSGTWKLKSVVGPGNKKSPKRDRRLTMQVTQDAISIHVSESGSWDGKPVGMAFVCYLDGRGESNKNAEIYKTTTHIVQRKLEIKGLDFEEQWTLSKDGRQLTRTHTYNLPDTGGPIPIVNYYKYARIN